MADEELACFLMGSSMTQAQTDKEQGSSRIMIHVVEERNGMRRDWLEEIILGTVVRKEPSEEEMFELRCERWWDESRGGL